MTPKDLPELPEPAGVIVVRCSALRAFIADQMHAYGRACYDLGARSTARPSDDALWDQTLRERDRYHEWADKLAEAISRFIGFDIGEHSNVNNPWARAVDMVPAGTLIEALAQARSTAAQPLPEAVEWETLDGTRRTTDKSMAQNWEAHVGVRVVRRAAANAMRNPRAAETWCGEEAALRALNGAMAAAQPPAAAQPVEPIAEGLLQSACARMLANANWGVAGALSPASKRKDFPSNGWASVKLRDLASVRDTLSAASGDSTPPSEPADGEQLWLWQNGDHFLAFRNLYPCYSPGGDPMTLGEPFGRAIFKHSHDRSAQGDPSGALRPEPEAAGQRRFPSERRVARSGDMAPEGHTHLTVGLDSDSDVYVSIWEQDSDIGPQSACIEFCTRNGGGRSTKTREALVALMCAIEDDNAAEPSKKWPRDRPPQAASVERGD